MINKYVAVTIFSAALYFPLAMSSSAMADRIQYADGHYKDEQRDDVHHRDEQHHPRQDSNLYVPAQTHAGQTDTDGILSPGERKNPNINYDKAQRKAERHDDYRVDNPYNDAAAAEARDEKRYQNDKDYRDSYDRREYERDHRDSRWDHN